MTSKAWKSLKKGSLIKSRGGSIRKVLNYNPVSQTILLKMIKSGCWRLWSGCRKCAIAGKDTTVYCIGDKLQFSVVRY